jgi:CHAD domain-containing protein
MGDLSKSFEELHGKVAEALLACRADVDQHAVHLLRTTTRRIEALLRKGLKEHPRAKSSDSKIEKALQRLKKVRRAAGPVRDIDVQRKLCAEIVQKFGERRGVGEKTKLQDEGAKLDAHLRRKRRERAKELDRLLLKAEPKLGGALTGIRDALKNMSGVSLLKTARELAADDSPKERGEEDLHSYRKRMKAPRYLAEMQGSSRAALALAKDLKRVLDDIGRWHDLMLLDDVAKKVLGKRSILTVGIARERDVALRKAERSADR